MTLNDGNLQEKYFFNIDVTNSAPKFINGQHLENIKMKLGEKFDYEITNVLDDEFNQLSIKSIEKPSFATFSGLIYSFAPTEPSQLGISKVRGLITDSYLELSFSFTVNVYVDPPHFSSALQD